MWHLGPHVPDATAPDKGLPRTVGCKVKVEWKCSPTTSVCVLKRGRATLGMLGGKLRW
jgi:hypothetical protein